MHFLLALQFLTRIPVTIRSEVTEKDLARSMAWFPAVGLLWALWRQVFIQFCHMPSPTLHVTFLSLHFWLL